MGLWMTPPLREGRGYAALEDAAVGERCDVATRKKAGECAAETIGKRFEGCVQDHLRHAEGERAEDVVEAFAFQDEAVERSRQRGRKLLSGELDLFELLLETGRVGVDGDGPGFEGRGVWISHRDPC